VIGERSFEAERHVAGCRVCRSEIESVEGAFSLFRASGIQWSDRCYQDVAQTLVSAASRLASTTLVSTRTDSHALLLDPGAKWMRLWAYALAASVLVCAVMLLRPAPPPYVARPPERHESPFLEIPYVAPLAPYERAAVTRMDVPVAALIAAGFEVHVADVGSTVKADVLFGQDGRAHAIRLVSDSNTD
jgi:hypothetical protein